MASEKLKLFSKIELELISSAAAPLVLLTDMPGNAMAARFTWTVPASNPVGDQLVRRTATSRLPCNTQGHLVQAIYTPIPGQTALLYRCRIWGRELPAGSWQWYQVPVLETPVEFSPHDLPIPPTTEDWKAAGMPIPPTTEDWKAAGLPIPPTSEEWRALKLPIKATPDVPDWVDMEVDS